ncbi:P-loop containing nucleoside triphosphate hydrolase protein [Macrolepiota fuliginosa MF-IS2]|uniref:P-loop containing nucleoside triphosphate hydrolase protein n=1 Tax=Macrolepiota fuliginosa MF-IS2 TaxID=1400762 RepID=A0A9P5XJ89_9AGAR|nr:P-loop containing nucleoside triphosphate hydrolase protein [Macrolepiota fuliginosa MF-IS2]
MSIFPLAQNILPKHKDGVTAQSIHVNDLSERHLDSFLSSVVDGKIGLAPAYDTQQTLTYIAFASRVHVLVIKLNTKSPNSKLSVQKRQLLGARIFMDSALSKYAFHMDKLCTSLFCDSLLRVVSGVDILSGLRKDRHLLSTKALSLGGKEAVNEIGLNHLFRNEESSKADQSIIAIQAWAAYQASLLQSASSTKFIDTTIFSEQELSFLAKVICDAEKLKHLKPLTMKNEIEDDYKVFRGQLTAKSARFSNRVRDLGSNQTLEIRFSTPSGPKVKSTKALQSVNGRSVRVNLPGAPKARGMTIFTQGREDPTQAEALCTNILILVIQKDDSFLTLPFVQEIWFPGSLNAKRSPLSIFSRHVPITFEARQLNKSQETAVKMILPNQSSKRLVLVQGPPGTGKTTVIAATVVSIMASSDEDRTTWLLAQSNVAVKNIAEKLADVDFLDFKLLVSKDFHFDWHEHLYEKIEGNIIRSDDFPTSIVAAERQLLGSRVILCTLSMLSNDRISRFAQLVPPTLLIIDEASQIQVGDYVPMLHRYQKTIRKLVFIGDDKQLPPYGQGDIKSIQSIFELPHLRKQAIFLDTQYRMPVPIGKFISQKVYGGRLKTVHPITSNRCCRFVDVSHGQEKRRGTSWINEKQGDMIISLARKMQGHSFRIVTPYDAQRALLENSLKSTELEWEDKVFNVDSFQGGPHFISYCFRMLSPI